MRVLHEMHHGQNRRRLKSRRLGKNREFLSKIGVYVKKKGNKPLLLILLLLLLLQHYSHYYFYYYYYYYY